jgi:hypothetical protein
MRKPGLLLLTASAGAALVTAAGPAGAVAANGTPAASDGYSLSIALAAKSIAAGTSDTVSGVLTKAGVPQAGDTVALRAWAAGRHHHAHRVHHAHRIATGTTGADGSVSFTVTPRTNMHYRLVFRAVPVPTVTPSPVPSPASTPVATFARSKVGTVHVQWDSSLSIRAHDGRHGRQVIQGQLRGHAHPLSGRKVTLQERTVGSDTWTTVRTHRTHRHGIVSFRVATPSVPEEFQLAFTGGPNYQGCQSGVVTIG